jgi:hypothetical protein
MARGDTLTEDHAQTTTVNGPAEPTRSLASGQTQDRALWCTIQTPLYTGPMPPNGPMRGYLQAVRGHPGPKSGPLTVERVVEFGLPLGLDSLGRLSREPVDYATEFVLGLKNVIADLPSVERAVATQYFFGSGRADNRQAAVVESLGRKNTQIARSRPRLAQNRMIRLVADGLLASEWFGSYRQELFGGRRRVSYGFALRSLHLTLAVGPEDPSDVTYTHDFSVRILKDRVRLIPGRYSWSGPSENELPPTLRDPRQRLLLDTTGPVPRSVGENEYSYYFIYLGRAHNTDETPVVTLTQRFSDPDLAMKPFFQYLAEQEGAWERRPGARDQLQSGRCPSRCKMERPKPSIRVHILHRLGQEVSLRPRVG